MPKQTCRPIDQLAKKSYSGWGNAFVFIKKSQVKSWQAIFAVAFIAGAAVALVWAVSNDRLGFIKASSVATSSTDTTAVATSTPPQPPSSANYISIISPNGGDFLIRGKKYDIIWKSSSSRVNLSLLKRDGGSEAEVRTITSNYPSKANDVSSYSWLVPNDLPQGDNYVIYIVNVSGPDRYHDTSDDVFRVVSTYSLRLSRGNNYIGGKATIKSKSLSTWATAGVMNFTDGETVTLTALPNAGYVFAGWSGDCASILGAVCDLNMDSDKKVIISFVKIGDVTGNNKVDGGDALSIAQYLTKTLQLSASQLVAADVNGNGKVNNWDGKIIMQYVGGAIKILPAYLVGDVNNDEEINVIDAMLIGQYLAGDKNKLDGLGLIAADVNTDGKVTAEDSIILANYANRDISSLPYRPVKGDVDMNSKVNCDDYTALNEMYLGKQAANLYSDINKDGSKAKLGDLQSLVNLLKSKRLNCGSTAGGPGALTAANGAKPASAIILGGSAANYLAQFTFRAASQGFTIDRLELKVPNAGGFARSIAGLTIKYKDKAGQARQTTQVLISGLGVNDAVMYAGLSFYVPANGSANLDVYADLAPLNISEALGAAGAVTFDYDEGFSATSNDGTRVTKAGLSNLVSNTFYVRKSKPTFARLEVGGKPSSAGGPLFKFKITADGAGGIDIKQLAFNIKTKGSAVNNLTLYDPISSARLTGINQSIDPSYKELVSSNGSNISMLIGGVNEAGLTIPSASTRILELRGEVAGFYKSEGDLIVISFKQDSQAGPTTSAYKAGADGSYAANQGNIWSDQSAIPHTMATADWTNGYLLKDMSGIQVW